MGIRFLCPNGHKLNVKGFQAGKRGICPHCEVRFRIPRESQIPSHGPAKHGPVPPLEPLTRTGRQAGLHGASLQPAGLQPAGLQRAGLHGAATADPEKVTGSGGAHSKTAGLPNASLVSDNAADVEVVLAEGGETSGHSLDISWFVRPRSGGQFGPAQHNVLQDWIEEGRVSSDSLIWREGWQEWRAAGAIFPQLGMPGPSLDSQETSGTAACAPSRQLTPPTPTEEASSERENNSPRIPRRRSNSAKSVATIVILAFLAAALLVVLVTLLQKS